MLHEVWLSDIASMMKLIISSVSVALLSNAVYEISVELSELLSFVNGNVHPHRDARITAPVKRDAQILYVSCVVS